MKKNTFAIKGPKGVTLIELTVVIAIILVLISVLFVGAKYYKDNADKAACIINISNLHKAMRSVQNIDSIAAGSAITFVGANTPIVTAPTCPEDSDAYTLSANATATGVAAATCPNGHAPSSTVGW